MTAKQSLIGGLLARFRPKPAGDTVADNGNALLAFPSETADESDASSVSLEPAPVARIGARPAPSSRLQPRSDAARPILIAVALLLVAGAAIFSLRRISLPRFGEPASRAGRLTIETRPPAADVTIDGEPRGKTPLTLSVPAGAHAVTIRTASDERTVPLTIAAGAEITQYFEMKTAEPAAAFGRLSVATEPAGARVAVDGRPRGTSPLVVDGLTAEEHKVTVTSGALSAERTVAVTGGGTASVLFSLSKASGPVGGWLSIAAPFDVEVAENEDVIGTSGASRIMLAAGRHQVVLANRTLGYQEARTIDVAAGKTVAIQIEAPKASLSVNARPWADITLDGNSVGQTPIANLVISIGSHEVVFKHPQFGERRQTVVVTAKGPNRIAVDLNK